MILTYSFIKMFSNADLKNNWFKYSQNNGEQWLKLGIFKLQSGSLGKKITDDNKLVRRESCY